MCVCSSNIKSISTRTATRTKPRPTRLGRPGQQKCCTVPFLLFGIFVFWDSTALLRSGAAKMLYCPNLFASRPQKLSDSTAFLTSGAAKVLYCPNLFASRHQKLWDSTALLTYRGAKMLYLSQTNQSQRAKTLYYPIFLDSQPPEAWRFQKIVFLRFFRDCTAFLLFGIDFFGTVQHF